MPNDRQHLLEQLKQAVQRNANQIQALKHVMEDFLRRAPSNSQLHFWEHTLNSITPLDINTFLDEQPAKKGRYSPQIPALSAYQ